MIGTSCQLFNGVPTGFPYTVIKPIKCAIGPNCANSVPTSCVCNATSGLTVLVIATVVSVGTGVAEASTVFVASAVLVAAGVAVKEAVFVRGMEVGANVAVGAATAPHANMNNTVRASQMNR